MKKILLFVVAGFTAAFFMVSCNTSSKHPGFEKTKTGLYYKFYHKSKDTTQPHTAEYVELEMVYGNPDTVIFDSRKLPAAQRPMKIPMIRSIYKGDIYEGLRMMHVGDSAVFQCNADSVFKKLFRMRKFPKFIDSTKDIYFAIKLVGVKTPQQIQAEESARMIKAQNNEAKEREAYLKKNHITVKPTADGLYFVPEKPGKGPHPKPGEKVSVHYTGYLLNGTKFDSSIDRGKPFEFVLGRHQVISGWDEGIAMLRKGGTAKLIIPSSLAYGPRNMGPIPPFSTLVFEVKLVDIKPGPQPKKKK
jgi:FKBP-type peptidyl-prolyl cis-trans isomerase FkpA